MNKEKTIVVKIESDFKQRIEGIFEELGITTSQAITIFLKQVELNEGLPFEIKLNPNRPNKLTRQTLKSRFVGLKRFKNSDELFDELAS